jgi:hypothetical protein
MKIAYLNQALNPREISPDVKKKSLIASQSLN